MTVLIGSVLETTTRLQQELLRSRKKLSRVLMSKARLNATRIILIGSSILWRTWKKTISSLSFKTWVLFPLQECKSRKIHFNLVKREVIIAQTKTEKTKIFIAKFPLYPGWKIVFYLWGNGIERRSNRSQSRSRESPSVSWGPGLQQLVNFSPLVSEKTSGVHWVFPLPPRRRYGR